VINPHFDHQRVISILRHTMHEEIRTRGAGAYSHRQDRLIFSMPDNSDPSANNRAYQIAFAR
jgi:hypothetical protein